MRAGPRRGRHPPRLGAVEPGDDCRVDVGSREPQVLGVPLTRSLVPARAGEGVVGQRAAPQVEGEGARDGLVERVPAAQADDQRRGDAAEEGDAEDPGGLGRRRLGADELAPGAAHLVEHRATPDRT